MTLQLKQCQGRTQYPAYTPTLKITTEAQGLSVLI